MNGKARTPSADRERVARPEPAKGVLGQFGLSHLLLFVAACAAAVWLVRAVLAWDRLHELFRYNTLVCLAGTAVLGASAGVVGTFMLLRKRALVGDVIGHAALPGVGLAFLVLELTRDPAAPSSGGKNIAILLLGAALSGLAGVGCTMLIRRLTRIKEDAALAVVLSVFFGGGMVLLTAIQQIPQGSKAGLRNYIFGMASALVVEDVLLISGLTALALVMCGALFKEFSLLCFDEDFAAAQGWPVLLLDGVLMGLVTCVAVVGMQSVGLLLVVALLIIPPAAARFWTDDLKLLVLVSALLGGASAALGVIPSALSLERKLPTGPMIVLVGSALFVVSLLLGPRRGVLRRLFLHWQLQRRVGRHDLLRAIYESLEQTGLPDMATRPVPCQQLLAMRSWSPRRLRGLIASAQRAGLLQSAVHGHVQLTSLGLAEAKRVIRNHRLWELYLITFADIAPSHVDRDADLIEHSLDADIIQQLEAKLAAQVPDVAPPPSPHVVERPK
jgi:manganese/zinc/iron transport system permease protein